MHPIVAHHAGEQALAPLLLLASGAVPLLLAMTQERLAAARARLARSRTPAAKAGYSRPHTLHCGPGAIFMSALGGANGNDGPGGVALLDHDSFEVIGPGSWTGASSTSPTTAGGTSTTTP